MRVFNLSLDDFSPHPRAGLNFESIQWCDRLIEKWPKVKINLFVPAAFARLGENPHFLYNHPEWLGGVKNLPSNYRINTHGYFHRRQNKKYPPSNNDEFQYLNRKQAEAVIYNMTTTFNRTGLKYRKTFRPPAWKISRGAAEVLTECGFIIAGDQKYYQRHKDIPKLRWISYNWDLNNPCSIKDGGILAFGHTSNWTSNYFCEKTYKYVVDLLNNDTFDFRFLEDLV
jgi:hypothetical protein